MGHMEPIELDHVALRALRAVADAGGNGVRVETLAEQLGTTFGGGTGKLYDFIDTRLRTLEPPIKLDTVMGSAESPDGQTWFAHDGLFAALREYERAIKPSPPPG